MKLLSYCLIAAAVIGECSGIYFAALSLRLKAPADAILDVFATTVWAAWTVGLVWIMRKD
jgi:hypothetical protein